MKYGNTSGGYVWHMLVDDKPLCSRFMTIIETRDRSEVSDHEICDNCDKALRDKGKHERKKARAKRPNPKTLYNPRHKLE